MTCGPLTRISPSDAEVAASCGESRTVVPGSGQPTTPGTGRSSRRGWARPEEAGRPRRSRSAGRSQRGRPGLLLPGSLLLPELLDHLLLRGAGDGLVLGELHRELALPLRRGAEVRRVP